MDALKNDTYFEGLAEKWLKGQISEQEKAEFLNWYHAQDDGQQLEVPLTFAESEEAHRARILAAIRTKIKQQQVPAIHRMHFTRRFRWVAAAVFLIAIATTYFIVGRKENNTAVIAKADIKAPATNRASIQLATGQVVYLDSSANGSLASLGQVQLVKLADGKIAYNGNTGTVTYNTISNPRGSRVIDMELTDGSHVWLNAGSSMVYPVPMTGKTRDVVIKGEAYFEVAKDASRPFTVSNGNTKVTVLGTHFNVNAYGDEKEIKVTLLEGAVRVDKGTATGLLKPGQQAIITQTIEVNEDADLDEVMAWKNGFFDFRKAGVPEVMRQLSRWYDVDVVFEGEIPERQFVGKITRASNASEVLKILELSNVHFRIEEKKIIMMP